MQSESDENVTSFCCEIENLMVFDCVRDRVISFIASHFFEMEQSFLIGLPISTFERVLSHDSLQIKGEDSFFHFLISHFEVSHDSISLLGQINGYIMIS
jgi:hypothetical protein